MPFSIYKATQILTTSRHNFPSIATTHLHSQLLTAGLLHPSPTSSFLTTKLLQLYADTGDIHSALRLFHQLPHPNIFAWTPIIAFLSRSGHHISSLSTFSRMRAAGISPDSYVLPVALRSAAGHLLSTASLHATAVIFAGSTNLHVSNALITAYSNSGDLSSANLVFSYMNRRDLLSWNSIISAFVSTGFVEPGLDLIRSMSSDGWDPDIVTWNTILDGYCRAGRFKDAVHIFNKIIDPNVVSYTIIMNGISASGNHEAALAFFRRWMMTSVATVPPDQDTLSCVVACCRHVGAIRPARGVHAFGLKTLDITAFYCSAGAALVSLYAGSKLILSAKRVFDLMDPTDVMKRNALIAGLTRAGMFKDALEQFIKMYSRDIGTDPTTFPSVLSACSLIQAKQIHGHVIRKYYEPATEFHNAIISAYARSGCITSAQSVFSAASPARDVVTWNAMITAYGSHGLGGPAINLAFEMIRAGPRPNKVTFTSVLAACSHAGLVDQGLEWFERFRDDVGLAPDMVQYSCVVDMLGRAGRFEEAVGFIRRMPCKAEGSVWGALMAACRAEENVEFGKLAFDEVLKVEGENAGNYVTMAGMYVREGRWDEARMVRKMMERRCVVKPYGYSRL